MGGLSGQGVVSFGNEKRGESEQEAAGNKKANITDREPAPEMQAKSHFPD